MSGFPGTEPAFKHSLQIFHRVEVGVWKGHSRSLLLTCFIYSETSFDVHWDHCPVRTPSCVQVLYNVYACCTKPNISRAWCCHHHTWQLIQCSQTWKPHLYSSKHCLVMEAKQLSLCLIWPLNFSQEGVWLVHVENFWPILKAFVWNRGFFSLSATSDLRFTSLWSVILVLQQFPVHGRFDLRWFLYCF